MDIGIGGGAFVNSLFRELGPGKVYGYDVNPKGELWLRTKGLWCDPYAESCGTLTCWDVLEHIQYPELLIQSAKTLLISIPIFESKEHILASKHYKPNEHLWYFTEHGLVAWLATYGFQAVQARDDEQKIGREDIMTYVFRSTKEWT